MKLWSIRIKGQGIVPVVFTDLTNAENEWRKYVLLTGYPKADVKIIAVKLTEIKTKS
jgi:hypothetical protein